LKGSTRKKRKEEKFLLENHRTPPKRKQRERRGERERERERGREEREKEKNVFSGKDEFHII